MPFAGSLLVVVGVGLADHTSNIFMEHQLWAIQFAFAILRMESDVLVYQFIVWFPEDVH